MKTAFLFSGQGAQYTGMMKDIVQENQAAQTVFDLADRTLGRCISSLCFEGPQDDLNLTHNTQPCVLAADLAAYAAITSYGIQPDAVAGFSLGEYGALTAAGVIFMENVFPLIQKRADFMQDAVPVGEGAMAAVMKLAADDVIALCSEMRGYVEPANYNCPGQIVVSGEYHAVEQLVQTAKQRKIRVMILPVSAPFHCKMMGPAAERLKAPLVEINLLSASVPVYMNVDGKPSDKPDEIIEKLIEQTKSPVHWEETIRNMYLDGIDTFIELGPGKTLSGFVKKTLPEESVNIYNVTDQLSLESTVMAMKGE